MRIFPLFARRMQARNERGAGPPANTPWFITLLIWLAGIGFPFVVLFLLIGLIQAVVTGYFDEIVSLVGAVVMFSGAICMSSSPHRRTAIASRLRSDAPRERAEKMQSYDEGRHERERVARLGGAMEAALKTLGAEGEGPAELANSVSGQLRPELHKAILDFARIRAELFHSTCDLSDEASARLASICDAIIEWLQDQEERHNAMEAIHDERLAASLQFLEQPAARLSKMAEFELLTKSHAAYETILQAHFGDDQLSLLESTKSLDQAVPPEITSAFHMVRLYRNRAAHDGYLSPSYDHSTFVALVHALNHWLLTGKEAEFNRLSGQKSSQRMGAIRTGAAAVLVGATIVVAGLWLGTDSKQGWFGLWKAPDTAKAGMTNRPSPAQVRTPK